MIKKDDACEARANDTAAGHNLSQWEVSYADVVRGKKSDKKIGWKE